MKYLIYYMYSKICNLKFLVNIILNNFADFLF
jgi:hypothetical protein